MSLNDQQQRIVDALEGSVNVVAGAGTGKTFTLTRRIVAAVKRSLDLDPGDADPTAHVLAITFTRKAAAELKSRVRQAFLDEAARGGERGEAYLRCALRIDNAWVSTIHGMASRILRENALEFGIDPSFKTLSAQGASAIFSESLQMAVDEVMQSDDADLIEFIGCCDLEGTSRASGAVASMVEAVLDATSYMPSGVDGIVVRPPAASCREACAPFMAQAHLVRRLFEEEGWPAGEAAKLGELSQGLDAALSALEGWLDAYDAWLESDDEDEGFDGEGLERALYSFPTTTAKFGKKSDHYEDMIRYRLEYKLLSERVAMLGASNQTASLVRFAKIVKRHMDAIKSAGHTLLTESDLLVVCNEKLSDPANAPILERYRRQFHCIMLDEFQDTDPLQMAIVSKLAVQPDEGLGVPPLSNVCTVGDMQQSIYRFRGGDVEETQKRIASLKGGAGLQFELSGNYRSHKDVLDAVEAVFSRPGVFGDEFLRLEACRSENGGKEGLFDGIPRVEFEFVHGRRATKADPGVSSAEARSVAAADVARHFAKLAERGARPSGMALLLGRMGNADVYAQALRNAGFECVIAGGSVFADTMPARLVGMLLRYAVNRRDEASLLAILTSPLFHVSDDALLALSRRRGGEAPGRFALSRALSAFEGTDELDADDNAAVRMASGLLADFVREARRGSAASALRGLFVRSGYLGTLQGVADAQALSDAGNVAKALRIVSELEDLSCGVAEVAARYASTLEHAKESPGTLATMGAEYVSIMTVHASKGLEFDHVALAEMRDGMPSPARSCLIAENIDGATYLSMRPTKSSFADPDAYEMHRCVSAFTFEDMGLDPFGDPLDEAGVRPGETKYEYAVRQKRKVVDAETPEATHRFLSAYERLQELEEARRLMYVAMTRARESLFVSVCTTTKPSSGYRGVFADVYGALEERLGAPEGGFDDSFRAVQGALGACRVLLASKDDVAERLGSSGVPEEAPDSESSREGRVEVPVYEDEPVPDVRPFARSRQGLHSYTSLSKGLPVAAHASEGDVSSRSWSAGEGVIVDDEFFLMASALFDRLPSDESATALGTAFHRLCQRSILKARQDGLRSLPRPDDAAVAAQVRACELSAAQEKRLRRALDLWLGSDLAASFSAFGPIAAEVPFSVVVEGDDVSFVLEGEIDGLADDGAGSALLVDYKTGATPATVDDLREKHRLQAQCYAYALLMAGYRTVEACFVRVEQEAVPESPADLSSDRMQPLVVEYSYSFDDVCALRDDLLAAYRYSLG